MFSFEKDVRQDIDTDPVMAVFYAKPGKGKTSLANSFPKPFFIQTEHHKLKNDTVDSFGLFDSYGQVIDTLNALYMQDNPYKTIVIDSLSELEKLVWKKVCQAYNIENIEKINYGKGYIYADEFWYKILDALDVLRTQKGYGIVMVAHESADRFDCPVNGPLTRYDLALHKRVKAIIVRRATLIGFIRDVTKVNRTEQGFNKVVRTAESSGEREICVEEHPAFIAKNTYDMPPTLIFKKGQGYGALKQFIETKPQQHIKEVA